MRSVVLPSPRRAEIEAEAQLLQERQFPAHDERRPHGPLIEEAEHEQRHFVEVGVGIALGQEAGQRGDRGERGERRGIVHDLGGKAFPQLDGEMAEMSASRAFQVAST